MSASPRSDCRRFLTPYPPEMRLTSLCPASWIAGLSSATTAAAAAARPIASTVQLIRLSPRSSLRTRSATARNRNQSTSSITNPPFSNRLGQEAKEPVGDEQNEHREQRRDWGVHGEIGTVCCALEEAVLLGPCLGGLISEELDVRAFLGGEELR